MNISATKTNQKHSPFRAGATPAAIGFCGGNKLFVEQRSTANYYTPYKFSGKEKDEETSYSYFGARYYLSDISIWLSVDPLKDKYPNMSPYMYCAGNPIKLIDPNGMEIEPGSQAEWNSQKKNISDKKAEFSTFATINKMSGGKLFQQETDRYNSLGNTLNTMSDMEGSTQMYSVEKTKGNIGCTSMKKDGTINLAFSSTALFTHEVTHGGQFENNDIGFDPVSGGGIVDYWDEFEAYKAQAAYAPESLPNQPASMTKEWLLGIKDSRGNQVYGGHGQYPINASSNTDAVQKSFPTIDFSDFGNNTLKSYYGSGAKFKKQ